MRQNAENCAVEKNAKKAILTSRLPKGKVEQIAAGRAPVAGLQKCVESLSDGGKDGGFFTELLFRALALGDVLHNGDGAGQSAVFVHDGRGGDTDREGFTSTIHANGLESGGGFTGHRFVPELQGFLRPVWWDRLYGFAENLSGGPAEHALGGRIPSGNPVLDVNADDRHGSGVNESAEALVPAARGSLARGEHKLDDIVGCEEQQNGRARGRDRGDDLDCRREPVDGLPDGDDFQKMRGATTDDEEAEGPKEIRVRQIGTGAANEPGQGCGDGDVGNRDKDISRHRGPNQTCVAGVAKRMWKKTSSEEEAGKKPESCREEKNEEREHEK